MTVTFDSNGGSAVESQTVTSGETATKPEVPIYAGYDFDGWYLNNTPYNFDAPVTEDITLIARWTEHIASGTPFFVNVKYLSPKNEKFETFFTLGLIYSNFADIK